MITKFLSNRTNLTILQLVSYFLLGYIMGKHLTIQEWIIAFIILMVLQFTTHLKSVANGMLYNQVMNDRNIDMKKILKKMRKDAKKKKKN